MMKKTTSRSASRPSSRSPAKAEAAPSRAARNGGDVDAFTRALGSRIRDERLKNGVSVRGFAARLGISPSLLSQIERGLVKPSVETLWTTVSELGLSLDDLFAEAGAGKAKSAKAAALDDSPVRRPGARRRIGLAKGVQWERLSARADPTVDFVLVTYDVGAVSSMDGALYRHAGYEYGYIVSGELAVTIGFDEYRMGPGDAISFECSKPHRMRNVGREPVVAVWFVQHPASRRRPPSV